MGALLPPGRRALGALPAGFRVWREGDALVIAAPARPGRGALAGLGTIGAGFAALASARLAAGAHGVEELLAWAAAAALAAVTLRFGMLTVELPRPRVLRAGPDRLEVTRWWPWGPRRARLAAATITGIAATARGDEDGDSATTAWEVRAALAGGATVTLVEAVDAAAAEAVAALVREALGRDAP